MVIRYVGIFDSVEDIGGGFGLSLGFWGVLCVCMLGGGGVVLLVNWCIGLSLKGKVKI